MRILILSAAVSATGLLLTGSTNAQNNHRLDADFVRADRNRDGFLDAGELAREFRGPNAKPVTHKDTGRPRTTDSAHPDHAFLATYDADRDGRISKAEFEVYEQRMLASLRAMNNRNRNYHRHSRTNYRQPYRHRGHSSRAYGTNPYSNQLRAMQRAYLQQRQAYYNQLRYGNYSRYVRGGYRGHVNHHPRHGGRR